MQKALHASRRRAIAFSLMISTSIITFGSLSAQAQESSNKLEFAPRAETVEHLSQPIIVQSSPDVVFSNTANITINDAPVGGTDVGSATPYPSNITVAGLSGNVTNLTVTLTGISHAFAGDIDVLLVGPAGQKFILMSDAILGDTTASPRTFTFSDAAAIQLPTQLANAVSGTYKPANYARNFSGEPIADIFNAPAPAGTYANPGPQDGGTATLNGTFVGTAPNGTWSLFVIDDASGDIGNITGGWGVDITVGSPPVAVKPCYDFFGSGRTSFATARAEGNTFRWSLQNNGGTGSESVLYGLTTDLPTPGYFDTDNIADLNVWRDGTYFLRPSTAPTTFVGIQWGQTGDIAGREADYDGDGRDDPTVVRNTVGSLVWYYLRSGNGTLGSLAFGSAATDTPIAGADYNGDGRADVTVIRNNPAGTSDIYYVADTTTGALILAQPWGEIETDAYVIGDYLGDTRADFAVWRGKGAGASGTWYIKENGGTGSIGAQWGTGGAAGSSDLPLCGDYNGDGKSDVAVYRQSNATYYWLNSGVTTSVGIQQFGQAGDLPFAALRAY